jgi:hypothetical protein
MREEREFSMKSTRTGVIALIGLSAGISNADIMSISGGIHTSIEQTGVSFDAMLDYAYTGGTSGTLTIEISNTTAETGIGGFLTGFVFNILSSDAAASAVLVSGTNSSFLNTGIESASPFGTFDAGAALGANWTGGGNPSFGLGVGSSGTFEFSVSALDADLLSSSSFVGDGEHFAVRFRGLADGGSDKLLAPAPGTGAMALIGLGLVSRRRR